MRLRGRLSIDTSPALRDQLLAVLDGPSVQAVIVDLDAVSYIDASGIATLIEGLKIAQSGHNTLRIAGTARSCAASVRSHGTVGYLRHRMVVKVLPSVEGVLMATVLENVGRKRSPHLDYVGSLNIQLWATLRAMGSALPFVGNRYRWQATVRQMLQIGVDALPMVALMAICTGFILAMQGASELRRFGAIALRHRPGCGRLHP